MAIKLNAVLAALIAVLMLTLGSTPAKSEMVKVHGVMVDAPSWCLDGTYVCNINVGPDDMTVFEIKGGHYGPHNFNMAWFAKVNNEPDDMTLESVVKPFKFDKIFPLKQVMSEELAGK